MAEGLDRDRIAPAAGGAAAGRGSEASASDHGFQRWLNDRLGVTAFYRKYGRKVFPVQSTFFLGEMALFAFVILVLTGIYLGLIYVPSNVDVSLGGQTYPEAYASVRLIESIPVANLFRNTHHWAAHVMIAAVILHLLRIYFTGTYRNPREINWVVGAMLLGLTLMAGFVGYALPYDAFAVTATGIGFGIARSIPWIGNVAADLFFGGAFPTLGSLARLYTIHVFVVPALIALLVSVHLLIILKQKHTQPGYARPLAEPGKVLGVPAWPYQALLAGELLLVMFGALFLLSAFVPPHPLAAYGPPSPATPEVKPDWYLMWIYGFLKIVPSQASVSLFGATIGPTFLGGLLFPAVVFAVLTFTPWIDRANRLAVRRVEYLQPPRQSPVRFALGLAVLAFLGTLFIAAYYDTLGLTLGQIWGIVIATPIVVGVVSYAVARQTEPAVRFDPSGVTEPVVAAPAPPAAPPVAALSAASAPQPAAALPPNAPPARTDVVTPGPAGEIWAYPTPAARADQARDNLVAALHEAAELAPLVRQLESDPALLEVLDYIDSLRLSLAESNQILQGVLRAAAAERAADGGTADGAPAE